MRAGLAAGSEKMTALVAALDSGATKAAVGRTIERSTLIDSLTRIRWSASQASREHPNL